MMVQKNKITIILEEDDISAFNNAILFALDLDSREHCMSERERKLANRLAEITND
jgi:hypothetical protein